MKLNIAKLQAFSMPDKNTILCSKGITVTRRLENWTAMIKITVKVDGRHWVWHDQPATPLDMQGWECLATQAFAHQDKISSMQKETACRLMNKLELFEQ